MLDAGDSLNGEQGITLQTKGKVMAEAMSFLGYDAMTLCDNDFRIGMEELRKRMAEAQFPILAANIVISDTGELLAQPYVIKDWGDHKVGIIGLTGGEAASVVAQSGGEPIRVLEPMETTRRYVAEVSERADIVIVLSCLGLEVDRQLAAGVEGIEVIVGGREARALVPPLQDEETRTIIARVGPGQGEAIGVLRLKIDGQGTVTEYTGQVVTLTSDFVDDPEMRAWLRGYKP